ncbi:hypothetical protein DFH07DRAFT_830997 [Mycena maculata]|uniref:Uncharacterized protein n=1 Tax=Mycena maculata TaxID=230809 RepID=A0AAD7N6P4_9AGAR|nr:hypothetical protein DFH07DRAFT_830997 [Mycena maculata]
MVRDVADLDATEDGFEPSRSRIEQRPAARKARLGFVEEQMHESSAFQLRAMIAMQDRLIQITQATIHAAEINEKHEATDRCLRVFNDIIFDTSRPRSGGGRVLDTDRKRKLKNYGLGYITQLLDPPSSLPSHKFPLPHNIEKMRTWALDILTREQQELCRSLLIQFKAGRNAQQHPAPDTETALEMTREAAGVHFALLEATLRSNPKRIKLQHEPADVNLELFSPPGTYVPVAQQRTALELDKRRKEEMEQQLAKVEALLTL